MLARAKQILKRKTPEGLARTLPGSNSKQHSGDNKCRPGGNGPTGAIYMLQRSVSIAMAPNLELQPWAKLIRA